MSHASSRSSCPQFHLVTERTSNVFMEAPKPPDTVEHPNFFTCADFSNHRSRSVPVFGVGEGVFQCADSGKYECYIASSLPEFRPVSSDPVHYKDSTVLLSYSAGLLSEPECTDESSMRTPSPLDTVVLFDLSCRRSRSGPAGDVRPGVSHPPAQGKYQKVTDLDPADESSPSSVRRCRKMCVYYQNVGGINTCINDYLLACSDDYYDIIALTETWLDDRTLSNQVCGQNYEVFRTDRDQFNSIKSSGGGVLIAVHRRLKAQLIAENAWSCVEQVWVSIKLAARVLYICVVYFPPDRIRDTALIDVPVQSLSTIAARALPADEIIIFGDFNLPDLKWRIGSGRFLFADPAKSTFHAGTNALLDGYSSNLLQQINSVSNENGRMLDLCFASKTDEAPTLSVAPAPLVKLVPHHPPLCLALEVSANSFSAVPIAVYYDFNNADISSIINVLLNIDWNAILDKDDVDGAVQTFTNIISYLIDRHVPKKNRHSSTHQPWQTIEIRRLKTAKRAALRRYSKNRLPIFKQHYLRLNHQYQRTCKRCHAIYLRGVQRKFRRDPKSFWKYVDEQRKESGLPLSMFHNGQSASDVQGICNLFSAKFSSLFLK
ncbi:uncharacterized protein LOC129774350 [Toxorhynchites rutilus septentrionalis]|uniref:uncharacterized protein LOC129774350 n=1 Tax=Toxorhynchites rutilus septentrionalis TaxID=329112 RepID=UPI00247A8E6E|nr:uncharacterized protein LOC129774350 [Toxorhynchites rutilus septentrionalis]